MAVSVKASFRKAGNETSQLIVIWTGTIVFLYRRTFTEDSQCFSGVIFWWWWNPHRSNSKIALIHGYGSKFRENFLYNHHMILLEGSDGKCPVAVCLLPRSHSPILNQLALTPLKVYQSPNGLLPVLGAR
jgi:hypothetical protein